MSLSGVIFLAGGQGTRLGGMDKSRIDLDGAPLIEQLADRLRPLAVPIHVAAPAGIEPLVPMGLSRLFDLTDTDGQPIGPLGGLAGAAAQAEGLPDKATLLSVPVDSPFLPEDFVSRAEALMAGNAEVVIGRHGGNTYPLTALWCVAAMRQLPGYIADRPPSWSVRRFQDRLSIAHADFSEQSDNPFRGINTPSDLETITAAIAVRQ